MQLTPIANRTMLLSSANCIDLCKLSLSDDSPSVMTNNIFFTFVLEREKTSLLSKQRFIGFKKCASGVFFTFKKCTMLQVRKKNNLSADSLNEINLILMTVTSHRNYTDFKSNKSWKITFHFH